MKDLNKTEIELLAIQTAEEIIESGDNCLEAYIESKRRVLFETAFQKAIQDAAFDERIAYGSDALTMYGCKSSISNTGNRLQYDKDEVIAEYKNLIKLREIDVKTATNSKGVYFDADGVQVDPVPVTYGSEVIKISF